MAVLKHDGAIEMVKRDTYKDFFCCDPATLFGAVVSEIVSPCHRLVNVEEESHDAANIWVRMLRKAHLSSDIFEVLVTCLNRARKVNESHKEIWFEETKKFEITI